MKRVYFFLALLASFSGIEAQTKVEKFNPGVVAEGVNYALPKTALKIQVVATKTTFTPGEFGRYAERYLHLNNVKTEAEVKWEIKSIKVSTYGVPDMNKVYTIKLKDKSIAPFVRLSDEGLIKGINAEANVASDAVEVPAPVVNKLSGRKYLTEEILSANSRSMMAELTAGEIYAVRESKNSITRGEADAMPKDGNSLQIVLQSLDEQEKALMQLFTGKTEQESVVETFTLAPDADVEKEVAFRFSSKLGLVDNDDLSGEPYYVSVKNLQSVPVPTEEEKKKRKIEGVVYNMPGMAEVKLFNSSSTIYSEDLPFGQFGAEDVLMSALFNKNATTKVTFSTVTGGLLKIDQ